VSEPRPGGQSSLDRVVRRRLWWLFVLIAIHAAVALIARSEAVLRWLRGDADSWDQYLAAVGLVPLLILLGATVAARRDVAALLAHVQDTDGQLAAMDATSHEWLWQATPDLVATYCSQGTGEVLGYYPEEMVGRAFQEFVHPDDRATVDDMLRTAISNRTGWTDVEIRWLHRDGHEVTLQGSAVAVLDEAGSLIGFRGSRRPAPADRQAHKDRFASRRRVEILLEGDELQIALQPIINITRDRLVAVEALARFPDGRGPDVWFQEASDTGLGLHLELLAVRCALRHLSLLPVDICLSLNASPMLILDASFTSALQDSGVDLARIIVEITEHAAVTGYDDIRNALAPLREHGLRLAVDDTGAGYASFNHVLRLRPDIIKLDRSLLSDINVDPARRAFVTAIVLLGLELGASVTGEGVETQEELDTLLSLGVEDVQGYFLARPDTGPATWQSWANRSWRKAPVPSTTHP
jgi:PAS domain S-box-containing protein